MSVRPTSSPNYLSLLGFLELFSDRPLQSEVALTKMAAMRSSMRVPAPSATLLRFLKSQSEGLCFFSANPRGFAFDHAAPRIAESSPRSASSHYTSKARSMSTIASTPAVIESSFLNLDFFWSRTSSSLPRASSVFHRSRQRLANLRPAVLYGAQRSASTDNGSWLLGLWAKKQKTSRPLQSDDLPLGSFLEDGGEAPMFNLGRNMSPKSANEAKLRCTEFDENGNVVLVNGEFKKSELIAKVCKDSKNREK